MKWLFIMFIFATSKTYLIMNKNLIAFLVVVIIGVTSIYAQKSSIHGMVQDTDSKVEIPYATVVITDALSSKIVQGITSNEKGKFSISNLNNGTYHVEVSFMGYESHKIQNLKITKSGISKALGTILLKPSIESLKEVVVEGNNKTVTTKIDRKTYSASDFETAKGGNAADVLNKLPSISVDPSGNVSVRGTSDFVVYLNGKPTQIDASTLLSQISGSTINKIDVITVPTARFDAQGKGGIINISTKTIGEQGLSISTTGSIGGSPWYNFTDKYSGYDMNDNRYGGGLNVVYNKKNISYYGGFNYNKKNVNGDRTGEARVLVKDPRGDYFHMDAAGERPEWYEYYSANAGIDIALADNQKLSGSYFYGNRTAGRSAFYVYNTYFADKDGSNKDTASEDWVYNPNTDERFATYNTFNIDYSVDFNEKSNLKLATSYETSGLTRELKNQNFDYNTTTDTASSTIRPNQEYGLSDDTPLKGFRFSADYSNKLSENSTLGFGLSVNKVDIAGDFKFENSLVSKDLNNSIDLNRGVYAAYTDFSGKTGKLNYIVGLRAEIQDQEMDVTNTDYLTLFNNTGKSKYENNKVDVFPSAHLSYAISEKDNLTAAASRRVNRPSVTNMAPFLYRRHFEVYEVGDPELEAEYLNNVEVTYDTKIGKNSISLTGFYRGTDNAVFRVNTTTTNVQNPAVFGILQENVLIRSYTNAGNSEALGAELNATVYTGSFAKLFIGGSLYNYTVKGDVFGYAVDNSSTNWSLKGNLNLDLTSQLKFNIDYNIKSRTITSQGRNDQFSSSNIAFNYKPKDLVGWDFSLRVLDIFQNNVEGLDTNAYNNQNEQIFYQVTDYYREGMIAELGVSYSFNMKGKTKKEKAVEGEKHFK